MRHTKYGRRTPVWLAAGLGAAQCVESDRRPPDPLPPASVYKLPCTAETCTCAWVPYRVDATWIVARACGSCRMIVTPARRLLGGDTRPDEVRAFDKAVRLNRLYGIGATGWTT
jgi:hypothetical protein